MSILNSHRVFLSIPLSYLWVIAPLNSIQCLLPLSDGICRSISATCLSHSPFLFLVSDLKALWVCIGARLGPFGPEPLLPTPIPAPCLLPLFNALAYAMGHTLLTALLILFAAWCVKQHTFSVVREIVPLRSIHWCTCSAVYRSPLTGYEPGCALHCQMTIFYRWVLSDQLRCVGPGYTFTCYKAYTFGMWLWLCLDRSDFRAWNAMQLECTTGRDATGMWYRNGATRIREYSNAHIRYSPQHFESEIDRKSLYVQS